ncbi:unnamed protein product, partial [Gulo gulo]
AASCLPPSHILLPPPTGRNQQLARGSGKPSSRKQNGREGMGPRGNRCLAGAAEGVKEPSTDVGARSDGKGELHHSATLSA